MDSQKDYVLRTVEERGIRFVQLWFTDVLGTPKAFNITPAELENALDEGMTFDGSAIDGFSRVQESRRPGPSRPQDLPAPALAPPGEAPGGPGRSATSSTWTARPSRATPARSCGGPSTGPATRASPSSPPPRWSTSTSPTPTPTTAAPGDPRHGLLLRPDGGRPGQRPAPAHGAHARGDGHPGRAQPSTRTPPASTRSTCATPTP